MNQQIGFNRGVLFDKFLQACQFNDFNTFTAENA